MNMYTIPARFKAVQTMAVGLVLGLLMIGMLWPQSAAAQSSTASLQAQINALLAQIAALQAQISGQPVATTASVCPYNWYRDLAIGATGPDVMKLQQFLNSDPATQVSLSGAGAPGQETQYYGPATGAAVAKFQNKYRSTILTPHGLTNATMYFGPLTRAHMNSICVALPTPTPTPTPTPSPEPTPEPEPTIEGEASLERFKVSSGDDTNLNEGQRNARIMDVEFNVEDGDVRISRIDVAFDHQLGDEDEPWDTFDSVALYDGNNKIASMSTDNEEDWMEDEPYNGAYKLRFSNLNERVEAGDTYEFTVVVTLQGSIDGADSGLSWDVFIPDNGIRARDGEGVQQYVGDESDTVNIDINEEGSDDELAIRVSEDDPEATTLRLEDNGRSDWMTVFAFDLDTEDSLNDIEIRSLPVSLTVSTATVATFVDDVRLVVNGTHYDDVSITDGITNTMTFDFDRNEFVIDNGDRETVELQVRFKQLASMYEGTTIEGSVDGDNIEAEGADDLDATQLSGAATSDLHTLRTIGAVTKDSNATAVLRPNSADDLDDDEGMYTISFDVTAFETDLFINPSAVRGTTLGTAGVNFVMEDTTGATTVAGTESASLASSATEVGGRFRVAEGQTETFTLTVRYNPATSGFYRLQLYSFNYAENNANPTAQQVAVPQQNYDTPYLSI